jgi:hypothetical protein
MYRLESTREQGEVEEGSRASTVRYRFCASERLEMMEQRARERLPSVRVK